MARRTVWMLATLMTMTAGPAWAATAPASAPAGAHPATSTMAPSLSAAHVFQDAYARAVALQGAIAMGRWADAQLQIADLRLQVYQLSRGAVPTALQPAVTQLASAVDTAAKAVDAQDARQ